MTLLASVTPQTIAKLGLILDSLNELVKGAVIYNIHEALDAGYDVVVDGKIIIYHAKHIKEVLGFLHGVRDTQQLFSDYLRDVGSENAQSQQTRAIVTDEGVEELAHSSKQVELFNSIY